MTLSQSTSSSFGMLVQAHGPALLRHLRHRVSDVALAEDLLQETLLKAAHGLDAFGARSSIKTWLYAIANHVVADHLRATARRPALVDHVAGDELADEGPSHDERLAAEATRRCVRRVVDNLAPGDRTAITLHDLDGLDCASTAQALGVSVGAAKVRVHRARARLALALNEHCSIERGGASGLHCAPRACPPAPR